ncbi:MAG: hypothetical protein WBL67_14820 [Nitrososphaeraceae archaeon]
MVKSIKIGWHTQELLEYQNGMVAIHPRFNKLITVLRTAVENGEGSLDMEALVTTTRMLLMFWR